jgi:hypothetical protein
MSSLLHPLYYDLLLVSFNKSIMETTTKLLMVLEFLNLNNPFCRTMALGSTQPLTEISTRNISWE